MFSTDLQSDILVNYAICSIYVHSPLRSGVNILLLSILSIVRLFILSKWQNIIFIIITRMLSIYLITLQRTLEGYIQLNKWMNTGKKLLNNYIISGSLSDFFLLSFIYFPLVYYFFHESFLNLWLFEKNSLGVCKCSDKYYLLKNS